MVVFRPSVLFALAALAGCASCSPPEDPLAGTDLGISDTAAIDGAEAAPVWGVSCATEACDEGTCTLVDGTSQCVIDCSGSTACANGWACEDGTATNTRWCACTPAEERPNDADDDCDGLVDEGFQKIAFWNIRDLSIASRDDTELSLIADVLEVYPLVAIAEINDTLVLQELERILDGRGGTWASYTSDLSGNSAASAERYGLLWQEDRFAITAPRLMEEVARPDGVPFGREPLLAEGRSLIGGFDFAIVIVHVTWGDGEEERIAEVRALHDYVDQARRVDPDVLLVGDMNLNAGEPEGIAWLEANANLVTTTTRTPPTKVDSANTYSHIFIDPSTTTEYADAHGVDVFDLFLFPNDEATASRMVSDHRPVWASFDVRGADDD